MANNPRLYRNNVRLGHTTAADSIGNALEPRYIPQQAPIQPIHLWMYHKLLLIQCIYLCR